MSGCRSSVVVVSAAEGSASFAIAVAFSDVAW